VNSCVDYSESWELFWNVTNTVFLPWVTIVLALSIGIYGVYRFSTNDCAAEKGWLILGFVALGAMVGITAGASKTPVLGTFLPAFLTFISGLLGYLFSKDSLTEWRKVIPFCMAGMLFASVLNAFAGTAIKGEHQKFEREYEIWLLEKKNALEVQKQILLTKAKAGKSVIYPVGDISNDCK
jgi:hypothetical protein